MANVMTHFRQGQDEKLFQECQNKYLNACTNVGKQVMTSGRKKSVVQYHKGE